jgi:2-oxoglutarate ferredoxin oxidoreductase subunit gamma
LAGHIIGRACALHGDKSATMIQSFGPEARGSSCSATLAISDGEVLYPYIERPDILVAMSSEGFEKYRHELKDDGILLYEQDLVQPVVREGQRAHGIPSTRIAESLGKAIAQNIVMVGFFAAATDLVSPAGVREAVRHAVPPGTEEFNLTAFDKGYEYFRGEVTQPVLDVSRPPLEGSPL